jgi:signal transduction histidine kinase/CheY-like chemotaxis protein/ligand-binding sensor domain-containing protein
VTLRLHLHRSRWRWLACLAGLALLGLPIQGAGGKSVTSDYLVKAWDNEAGLPFIAVTAMAQTPDGYLWLGSFSGLVRFDGNRFTVERPANVPVMAMSYIISLLVSRDGALWVGTSKGVARFHEGRWTSYGPEAGLPTDTVRSLSQGPDGRIFLTSGHRLFGQAGARFVEFVPAPSRTERDVMRICFFDHAGLLWSHVEDEISFFRDGRWQTVLKIEDVSKNAMVGATPARAGGVWIADYHLIRRWHDGEWRETLRRPGPGHYEALRLLEDDRGNLWAGGYVYGVWVHTADGRWLRCGMEEGLQNNATLSLFQDDEDNVWIGSNGGGVARLRPRAFGVFDDRRGFSQPIINALLETGPGQMLVATHGGGVRPFDGQQVGAALTVPGLNLDERSWVHALAKGAEGELWVGTYDEGLIRVQGPEAVKYEKESLGSDHVYGLFLDSRNRLWIGTDRGVVCHEAGEFTRHPETAGTDLSFFHAFAEDRAGVIWALSRQSGLWRLNGGRFEPVPRFAAMGTLLQDLGNLYRDRDGYLWVVGDGQLLARQRDDGWHVYPPGQLPPAADFVAVVEDAAGDFWLSSLDGIYHAKRAALDALMDGKTEMLDCNYYDQGDGLRSATCRSGFQHVSLRTADNRLWFGTLKGIAVTTPARAALKNVVPRVLVETVEADGKILPLPTAEEPRVRVPAGTQRVDIRYTGISLGLSERVSFFYQVTGIDTQWVAAGLERVARLPDLKPGDYVLRVRAQNREGREFPPVELPLTVEAFIWQTWWFRAAWIGALIAAGGGVLWTSLAARYRRESERLAQAGALAEERARAAQARQETALATAASRAKSDFLATMSHEIRTPLNGVIGSADMMLETPLNPDQREHMATLRASAEALLAVLNDILDFSKIEAGHVSIEEAPFDLPQVLIEVVEVCLPRAQAKGIELVLQLPPDVPVQMTGDAARLRQVLLNLLSNAVKFTEHGHVGLGVEVVAAAPLRLRFTVTDSGVGIPPDAMARLFERFSQADISTTRKYGGTGLGLAICRRLVALMAGSITVDSKVGQGTRFLVELPGKEGSLGLKPTVQPVSVLVVDDLPEARVAALGLLLRSGYSAEAVAGWPQAQSWLRRAAAAGGQAVLLLDESVAANAGAEIARELAALPTRVPLVLMSGRVRAPEFELGQPLAGVLRKPLLRVEALQEAVRLALRGTADPMAVTAAPLSRRYAAHVLVADDDPVNRLVVTKLLEGFGCKVDIATNGAEAVALAKLKTYALIFMDCRMPEMDGFTATLEIRRTVPAAPPIIAITANNTVEDRRHCEQVGMVDFISKPIRRADMQGALERWLPPGPGPAPANI